MMHLFKYICLFIVAIGFSAVGYTAEPIEGEKPAVVREPCPGSHPDIKAPAPDEKVPDEEKPPEAPK